MTDTARYDHRPDYERMGHEVRVFGPPGTGKTTFLAGAVRATAQKRNSNRILVGSFTRAAAAEIAGRDLPIPRGNVGTLHALAYRSIDRPPVAAEQIDEWNQRYPALRLSVGSWGGKILEEGVTDRYGSTEGDEFLSEMEVMRARMIDRSLWRTHVRAFAERWDAWKSDNDLVDFTDMIDIAYQHVPSAPGDPEVGFFDEVQDFTPLELALVRKWSKNMERVVLAGDDDQCIYHFKGATPDAFLDVDDPDNEDSKMVLTTSHRVPRAVHAVSQAWVERLTRREPKVYRPRDDDGNVRRAAHRWEYAEPMVEEIAETVEAGRTVMVLATCSYMLDPAKHRMRDIGLPFWNPYRRTRGDWNPLRPSQGVSASERLISYLIPDERLFGDAARLWTGKDIKRWSAIVKTTGVMKRGARKRIEELPDGREIDYPDVVDLFVEEYDLLDSALEPSMRWLRDNLLASSKDPMKFPMRVLERGGPQALIDDPRVVIGTIHSVKGGQADVVYLLPDLSLAGMREWDQPGEGRDAVIRQFYVGMTRAREELVVCHPSGPFAVDPVALTRTS